MKALKLFVCCSMILLSGCGHNIAHIDRGTGFVIRIPLPDGSSLIDLKLGNIDSQTLVLRGGSNFTSDMSKGGTFGAISTGDHTQMTTVPSINEGYLMQAFTSKAMDPQSKLMLAKYLMVNGKTQSANPASTTSVNAGSASGNNPPQAYPTSTGFDNAVNKVADAAPDIIKPVVDGTVGIAHDARDMTRNVTHSLKGIILYLIAGIIVLSLCLLAILYYYYKWKKKHTSTIISKQR